MPGPLVPVTICSSYEHKLKGNICFCLLFLFSDKDATFLKQFVTSCSNIHFTYL